MKKILILLVLTSFSAFSQIINDDGTISNAEKRKLYVEMFKEHQTSDLQYDLDEDYFVMITKEDCENKHYDPTELQRTAMAHCFGQLLTNINSLKKSGFDLFTDVEFKGIIFKTNTICMLQTRRYHFKFTFAELNRFPEYMDFSELINYITVQNQNRNIVYIKNDK